MLSKGIMMNNSLIHLDLRSTAFSKDGMDNLFKALCTNKTITCLRIGSIKGMYRNLINGKSISGIQEYLKTTKMLFFLDLKGAGLGNEGVQILADSLKYCKSIRCLDISMNSLEAISSPHIANIISKSAVERIDISYNPLGNTIITENSRRISFERFDLVHFSLSFCNFSNPALSNLYNFLRKDQHLKHLELKGTIHGEHELTGIGWFIANGESLIELSLSNCAFGDSGVQSIVEGFSERFPLKHLDLSSNKITDKGAIILADKLNNSAARKLISIDLSQNFIAV